MMSMTGFARLVHQTEGAQLTIELKSINHRYCEIQFNLPEVFSALELAWRNFLKEKLKRGKIDCCVQIQWRSELQKNFPLNESLLTQLLNTLQAVSEKSAKVGIASPLEILKWPGVIDPTLLNSGDLQQHAMHLLQEATEILMNSRAQEGEKIKVFIQERLEKIHSIVEEIRPMLSGVIELLKQRLLKKFEEVKIQLDTERLSQEMVLFAQRLDVAEELGRLEFHLKAVHDLLKQPGNIGRKLDFLMQELNREANTLGSKSLSAELTQQVVAIKICIEEMREQVQNVE